MPKEADELCAGGVAEGVNVVGSLAVLRGVGTYPAHGALYVVELRGQRFSAP